MILEKVIGPATAKEVGNRRVERIVLASEELAKHRQRAHTDAGREVGIMLPHGASLRDGDLLHLDDELAIVVDQAEEELLRFLPQSPEEFGVIAYQVGNLHRAAMIDGAGITVLLDPAVEALAERFRFPIERIRGKFRPIQNNGHRH